MDLPPASATSADRANKFVYCDFPAICTSTALAIHVVDRAIGQHEAPENLTDEHPLISLEPPPAFDGLGAWTLAPRSAWSTAGILQLRACGQQVPIRLADQQEMFLAENAALCLRYDLGTCLAPCASGCSSAQYAARVRAARGFLGGSDLSPLTGLEKAMTTAAAAQRDEEAAVLRDQREALESLHEQLQRFRELQRHYNFITRAWSRRWLLVVLHPPRPSPPCHRRTPDRAAAEECLAAIERIYTPPVNQAMREDVEMTLLVASWFRSRPDELQRTLSPEDVKERLRQCMLPAGIERMPDGGATGF